MEPFKLSDVIRGEVLLPGDKGWDAAVATWCDNPNDSVKRTPAIVVRPKGTDDIRAALMFARDNGLDFSVKGGGHSPVNAGLSHGGLTVDMSSLRSCHVDPAQRIAIADGGCLLEDIDAETALYDLLVPLGMAPITGMGLALNGGHGTASRSYGATCDSIIAATVVTADGQVLAIDADTHSDLFCAICGAGSAFAVVRSLTFSLHPAKPYYGGYFEFDDDEEHIYFRAVAKWMRDVGYFQPMFGMNMMRVTDPTRGAILRCMVSFLGDEISQKEKAAFLAPLKALQPRVDTVGKSSYYETQCTWRKEFQDWHRVRRFEYNLGGQVPHVKCDDDYIDMIAEEILNGAPPGITYTYFVYDIWGGQLAASSCPIGCVDSEMAYFFSAMWTDPEESEAGLAFAERSKRRLAEFSAEEKYVNMSSDLSESKLAARVAGPENLAQLRAIKKKWDPDDLICNHPFKGML